MIADTCGGMRTVEQSNGTLGDRLETNESHPPHSIETVKKYFADSKRFKQLVAEALECEACGLHTKSKVLLATLPDEKHLLMELIAKLSTKSVGKTLAKIAKNIGVTKIEEFKGWSSLATHAAIEIEQGQSEYRLLLPRIYEKLGALLGEI